MPLPEQKKIVEQCDLIELMDLSTTAYNTLLTSQAFRQRFSNKTLKIHGRKNAEESKILYFNDAYMVLDMELTQKLLSKFGHLIEKIEVNFELINTENHARIVESINKYCVLLTEFELSNCNGDLLKGLNKQFYKVEQIRFSGQLESLSSDHLKFNQLFPALRHLNAAFIHVTNPDSFNCELPHLEHLDMVISNDGAFTESNLEKMLKKNIQINNLKILHISPEFLPIISESLPKLEKLYFELFINTPETPDNNVHFATVKEVNIVYNGNYSPKQLSFDQLETLSLQIKSLQIYTTEHLTDDWIDFIAKHKQLKIVRIKNAAVNSEKFKQIGAMSHLTEIRLTCAPDVSGDTITQVLQSATNLQKFFLIKTNRAALNTFRNKLNNDWTIVPYIQQKYIDVYFVRKSQ